MFDIKECLPEEDRFWLEDANRFLTYLEKQKIVALLCANPICAKNPQNLKSLFDLYRYSALERLLAIADGMSILWNNGNLTACNILERSFLESIATQHLFINEFERYMNANNYDKAYFWVTSNVFALRSDLPIAEEFKDIHFKKLHINDAIRKIGKKHDLFEKLYNSLSDIIHPNFLGVAGAFTRLSDDETHIVFTNIKAEKKHDRTCTISTLSFLATYIGDWNKGVELSEQIIISKWKATDGIEALFEIKKHD